MKKLWAWWQQLDDNYQTMRRVLDEEAREIEARSVAELREASDGSSVTQTIDGHEYQLTVNSWGPGTNGDLEFCIDISGLPTRWGIKPSHHFFKRADGSVYY